MGRVTNRPFKKGKTLYGGSVPSTGANYSTCGTEYDFEHTSTGRRGVLRAVKNASGITLYGKQPVVLNAAGTQILGYARLPNTPAAILDDELSSAGVVANDVCYVVVKGVATVKTAGANLLAIAAGDNLCSATQAASTAAGTTAAAINKVANATAGTDAQTLALGIIARAISAATTNNTATDILANIDTRLI